MVIGMLGNRVAGISMIEVLVTLLILALGLLGVMGLQTRLQQSEVETYQRSQALILLDDMASRLSANRGFADAYVTGANSPLGYGMTCPSSTASQLDIDRKSWCEALQGAAEDSSGAAVGAMLGGRGCVESLGTGQYLITVAWQGLDSLSPPAVGVGCGKNAYDTAGTRCVNDLCRRAVTTIVRVGTL